MYRDYPSRLSMVCFCFSFALSADDFAYASGTESPENKEIVIDENTSGCIGDMPDTLRHV